jgi:hypothetical protein
MDMFLHFIVGVLLYILCKYVFTPKGTLSIILLVALGKEVYDFISYGFYPLENIKDIFFTLLGPVYCLYFAKITKNS